MTTPTTIGETATRNHKTRLMVMTRMKCRRNKALHKLTKQHATVVASPVTSHLNVPRRSRSLKGNGFRRRPAMTASRPCLQKANKRTQRLNLARKPNGVDCMLMDHSTIVLSVWQTLKNEKT